MKRDVEGGAVDIYRKVGEGAHSISLRSPYDLPTISPSSDAMTCHMPYAMLCHMLLRHRCYPVMSSCHALLCRAMRCYDTLLRSPCRAI